LHKAKLHQAHCNAQTRWPKGFDVKAHDLVWLHGVV
jgi:hypothetical protein